MEISHLTHVTQDIPLSICMAATRAGEGKVGRESKTNKKIKRKKEDQKFSLSLSKYSLKK